MCPYGFLKNVNTSFENDIKEGKMKETMLKEHQKNIMIVGFS